MARNKKVRIFLTGVGGQGTLTATVALARAAMEAGLEVTAGEVHGMAQRGGVVESFVLIGGFASPRLAPGEADVLLGFEPLETLRALPNLAPGGTVVSSEDPVPTIGVTMGREKAPDLESVKAKVAACAGKSLFLPAQALGIEAGAVQAGNMALLGALCASRAVPLSVDELKQSIRKNMKAKLVDMNIRAVDLGAERAGR